MVKYLPARKGTWLSPDAKPMSVNATLLYQYRMYIRVEDNWLQVLTYSDKMEFEHVTLPELIEKLNLACEDKP
jgi:hypothetical protein